MALPIVPQKYRHKQVGGALIGSKKISQGRKGGTYLGGGPAQQGQWFGEQNELWRGCLVTECQSQLDFAPNSCPSGVLMKMLKGHKQN